MRIVIIGSGLAGITFAEELLRLSPNHDILIVTRDSLGHYSRPMLSHGFSRDDIESKIILKSFEDLRKSGIEVQTGCMVKSIDRSEKRLIVEGAPTSPTIPYDHLVLAPGSSAHIPEPYHHMGIRPRVVNSLEDLKNLRSLRATSLALSNRPRWAVIGGGLIGCELASDMAKAGDGVTLFHPLPRLMERQLLEEDALKLEAVLDALGVELALNTPVLDLEGKEPHTMVKTENKILGPYTAAILCAGFKPRIGLAKSAALKTDRGIVVDNFLSTEDPAISALGDAAECANGRIYAYVLPIRHQALWLARKLSGLEQAPWSAPEFSPRAKIHGFQAAHPYRT